MNAVYRRFLDAMEREKQTPPLLPERYTVGYIKKETALIMKHIFSNSLDRKYNHPPKRKLDLTDLLIKKRWGLR